VTVDRSSPSLFLCGNWSRVAALSASTVSSIRATLHHEGYAFCYDSTWVWTYMRIVYLWWIGRDNHWPAFFICTGRLRLHIRYREWIITEICVIWHQRCIAGLNINGHTYLVKVISMVGKCVLLEVSHLTDILGAILNSL